MPTGMPMAQVASVEPRPMERMLTMPERMPARSSWRPMVNMSSRIARPEMACTFSARPTSARAEGPMIAPVMR